MKQIKRITCCCVILVIVFSLSGCANSQVRNVMSMIRHIGTISIDSKDDIDIAYDEYNKLSDDDKKKVKNIDDLENAKKEFDKLVPEYIESFMEPFSDSSYKNVPYNEEAIKEFVADYYNQLSDEQIEEIGCAVVRAKAEDCIIEEVKKSMKNPSSFELVSFDLGYIMKNDDDGIYFTTVDITYRGTNSFGGVVPDSMTGMVDFNVDIWNCTISIESSLFM